LNIISQFTINVEIPPQDSSATERLHSSGCDFYGSSFHLFTKNNNSKCIFDL
jgi:hypothetical protein